MSCLRLYLLGPPRVERTDGPCTFDRRKAMALLAYLAVTARRQPRDVLATLFWPELDQSRARAALRRTLVAVKQGIGEGWLDADREAIGLDGDRSLWTDVARFHECLTAAQAHDHPRDGSCSACLAAQSEAAALYRDAFMAGFTLRDSADFDDWQREQGECLRHELAGALETLSHGCAAQGDTEAAIGYARRRLSLDPLREAAHRQLMRLYAQSGQRAAAIAQYRACRDQLRQELALSPSQETAQLYRQIRENRLSSSSPAQPVPPSHLPQQATPFVGRTSELADIAQRLADPGCRLLTLAGPGGIGKTRLAIAAAAAQGGSPPSARPAWSSPRLRRRSVSPLAQEWARRIRIAPDRCPRPNCSITCGTRRCSSYWITWSTWLQAQRCWRNCSLPHPGSSCWSPPVSG